MAILDVIEYLDPTGKEIAHRVPEHGSGEFRLGSQLIVRENQNAVFFRDGKALDTFEAGRHTLSTNNIPLLANILSIPFGGTSPFRAEVYFIGMQEFLDQKWGTPEPIVYRDTDFGIVRLRAFGNYSFAVNNASMFVNKVVGTRGLVSTAAVADFLRAIIVSSLTDLLGENMKSILDLPSLYSEIGAGTRARVQDNFNQLGLDLRSLIVQAITPPEDVQKAIDTRSSMGAIGLQNMGAFAQYQAAQAMRDVASNPGEGGGMASAGLGLGAGAGLGAAMAGMINQSANQPAQPATPPAAPAATTTCPHCSSNIPASSKFCPECGKPVSVALKCKNCQADLAPGAKFCANCGTKVE